MSLSFFVADLPLTFFLLADVGIASIHARETFQNSTISTLCDHQELACTPQDPLRRVNMNEMSFRNIYGTIYWVTDNTVSEPTVVTPIRFAEIT